MFRKGQVVTIYEDPVTQTKPEGKTKLVSYMGQSGDGCTAWWMVQFLDDDFPNPVFRFIKIES